MEEFISRRRFMSQAAVAGAATAMPLKLFGDVAADEPSFPVQRQVLAKGWKLKHLHPQDTLSPEFLRSVPDASQRDGWMSVDMMPAMVHEVLLAHGVIREPWRSDGLEQCAWVQNEDWIYALEFAAPSRKESSLLFQRMEGNVDVYVNGEKLGSHSDVNAPLELQLSGSLPAKNFLVLHFRSGPRSGQPAKPVKRQSLGSYLGPNPDVSAIGVFDRVFLQESRGTRFSEVSATSALNEALNNGTISVEVNGRSARESVRVRVRLYSTSDTAVGESTTNFQVAEGAFSGVCRLALEQPSLWWPRGYGEQPLYRAEICLLTEAGPQQVVEKNIGFRRIVMHGRLEFVVNNIPVFLRGASFLMDDVLSKVWHPSRMERLFALAENANFNTFRVWAERASMLDEFYDSADARGFLLWQDLSLLPLQPDEKSRALAREMTAQQVNRLKHHTSILCWCGGNETPMWYSKDFDPKFQDHGPWPNLTGANEVGGICKQLDPDRYFQISSPYSADGFDPNDPRTGDTHGYTSQWFVPGYDFVTLATEDTRICAPPLHSLERFMAPKDIFPAGYTTLRREGNRYPYPESWLPYTTSESWDKVGAVEQFYDATDAGAMVHRLGMAASLYYHDTVERQRRGRSGDDPSMQRRSHGYIAWKFNDSWPQIYSAKVDYFLEPYYTYYALRRAYAPVLLSFEIGTFLYLWVVNDSMQPLRGMVKIVLYHTELHEFRNPVSQEVYVAPGKSLAAVRLDQVGLASFRREHLLFATLSDPDGTVVARCNDFVQIERRMLFPDAHLKVTVKNGALEISTDVFARTIVLEGDDGGNAFGWFFEDNYFDLFPGEVKTVRVLGGHRSGNITAKSWFGSQATRVSWGNAGA